MSSLPAPPAIRRLSELKPGERGTFFALLADRNRSQTREGKPFYTCRFRDARRTATYMVWGDGPHFAACESGWQPGQFFKINARYEEHERYGAQIDVLKIRLVEPRDEADGFDRSEFVEGARLDPARLLADLRELIQAVIADEPLRRLTLGLIDRHADVLPRLAASGRRVF